MTKKIKSAYPKVIQLHHLDGNHKNDDPANHAYISKGEHFLLGRMAMYTRNFVSEDFVKALWDFVDERWLTSVNLESEYKRRKNENKGRGRLSGGGRPGNKGKRAAGKPTARDDRRKGQKDSGT